MIDDINFAWKQTVDLNDAPVIGIISMSLEESMLDDPIFDGYSSYIMSSYVKYFEAQGARVVPLIYDESDE